MFFFSFNSVFKVLFVFLFINTRERVYLDKNKVCKRMFSIVCYGIFDGKTQTDTNAIRILTFMSISELFYSYCRNELHTITDRKTLQTHCERQKS